MQNHPLLFELGSKGSPAQHPNNIGLDSQLLRTTPLDIPTLAEVDVVRHFTNLSRLNYGVDNGFYPLGSCTMKYNPRRNEKVAAMPEVVNAHPWQAVEDVQGLLGCLYDFEEYLQVLLGFSRFTLQPMAGAHGEMTGLMIIKAYHLDRGDNERNTVIVPDSSHGTNPATAACVGWHIVTIPSDKDGGVDLGALKQVLNNKVAALMLTNPNTVGLFDRNILEITRLVHEAGGLCYYDGANANATIGKVRPADLGFDVAHFNLHKTFSTPHGGGGPGSGPVGVVANLAQYLPAPLIEKDISGKFQLTTPAKSYGSMHPHLGNVGVSMRAYAYCLTLGREGFPRVSENAVLNANYLRAQLKDHYRVSYDRICQHEFVISVTPEKKQYGISALDIAKRLIDYGYHPPTIYFPLIVHECLMIEPTETESKQNLDAFVEVMITIKEEIKTHPELLHDAPHHTPVRRLDEAKAVKEPRLTY